MLNNKSPNVSFKKHCVNSLITVALVTHSLSSYSYETESVTCMHNGKPIAVGQTVKFTPNAQRIRLPENLKNNFYEVWECSKYNLSPSADDTFVAGIWVRRKSSHK